MKLILSRSLERCLRHPQMERARAFPGTPSLKGGSGGWFGWDFPARPPFHNATYSMGGVASATVDFPGVTRARKVDLYR